MIRNRIEILELIDDLCEQFESLLKQNKDAEIADWIKLVDEDNRAELFVELLRLETHHRSEKVYANSIGDYFRKFPQFSNEIVKVFASNRESDTDDSNHRSLESSDLCVAGDMLDRFEIVSLLGAGGFSAVYLARDPERSQPIALKVLNSQGGIRDARQFESIVNEANVLSCIDHPAVPGVFDAGESSDGRPWVSMEFIKGESLYKCLATDRLSLTEILNVLVKTAHALHEVHEAGFSHRDIKPDNIIIGLDGEPRILDFGLALHENLQLEKSGERAGTTAFMSPEQVQGQSEDLDGRTDIWSLGVILYLVIAKRLPFQGDTKKDTRREILKRPAKPPRQIKHNTASVELEKVCLRALNKQPQNRYSTAKDFANELQQAIDALPNELLLQDISRTRSLTKSEQCQVELAQRARLWNAEPRKENLPGFIQYAKFRTRSNKKMWTETESVMMNAASRSLRNATLVLASVVIAILTTFAYMEKVERDAKVRDLVAELGKAPVSEVLLRFEDGSSFASQKCLDAVRAAFDKTGSKEDTVSEHLRYAIILSSKTDVDLTETFQRSLINAKPDEIETLANLVFTESDIDSVPVLDKKWRQRLSNLISNATFVSGMENVWKAPTESTIQKFESFGGSLTDRYGMCTKMTVDEFTAIAEELREFRYQPVCVRPWTDLDNNRKVAAIWHRSPSDWKVSWYLSPREFVDLNSKESMYLVDVSDGLEAKGGAPELLAVWSSRKSPYGKARHKLLAQRIPQLSDPAWQHEEDSSVATITKDIDTNYLENAPLLADVCLHPDIQFTPKKSLEQQKLAVGEMILRACQPDYETIPGTPEHHRLEVGARMKAEAFYSLERFQDSSEQFLRKTGDGKWPEIWTRTLSYAKSGNVERASHSMALLNRILTKAVKFKAKPYVRYGVARAISSSVRIEMEFWEDKNVKEFVEKIERRIRFVGNAKAKRKFSSWAEFYGLALASQSVAKAVAASSDENAAKDSAKLIQFSEDMFKQCFELNPTLEKTFLQRPDNIAAANGSRLVKAFMYERQMPVRSSVWSSDLSNFESKFVEPRAGRQHDRASNLADRDGYFPVTIVFGARLNGSPKIGSIWHRELETDDLARREQRLANAFCFALCHGEDVGVWKILQSPDQCSLKQRLLDSMFRFKVHVSVLLDRLDETENLDERLSILAALRHYSSGQSTEQQVELVLNCLDRIVQYGSPEEQELEKIIQINLTPIQTTK